MRFIWLLPIFLLIATVCIGLSIANEDNEFAEFEDETDIITEEKGKNTENTPPPQAQKQESRFKKHHQEDFDDDFGIDNEEDETVKEPSEEQQQPAAPLKFADVPSHFRSNWASYQCEAIVLGILLVYLINYIIGKTSNQSIAHRVFELCKPILEEQFVIVGDDGTTELDKQSPKLIRETDSVFSSWCTGRVSINSMHLQMKMVKRQDLVSRVMDFYDPSADRMTLKCILEETNDCDPIVLAFGEKKTVGKQVKEMLDLATFAMDRKQAAAQFNMPPGWSIYSDQNEVIYSILEPGVIALLKKFEDVIELVHISDQYTGPKPPEGETYTRLPEPQRHMNVILNIQAMTDEEDYEELLNFIFYLIDKVRKFKLSKDAKLKAEKRRKEFEEAFLKTTHQFRQEAAQARREEKTRERKQKLLDESDPDRQRRLEAKELKREAKAKQPKMKQLKVK